MSVGQTVAHHTGGNAVFGVPAAYVVAFMAYGKTGICSAGQYGYGYAAVLVLIGAVDGHFGHTVVGAAVIVGIPVGPEIDGVCFDSASQCGGRKCENRCYELEFHGFRDL